MWRFPILQARKTNFHHTVIAVIEAAPKSTCDWCVCPDHCFIYANGIASLQHVIPEADLASLAGTLSKRSLLGEIL